MVEKLLYKNSNSIWLKNIAIFDFRINTQYEKAWAQFYFNIFASVIGSWLAIFLF